MKKIAAFAAGVGFSLTPSFANSLPAPEVHVVTPQVSIAASIAERVVKLISEKLVADPAEVTRETKFKEDLGADSLDLVELVMEFEQEFGIEIPDEAAERILTVGQAIDFVSQHAPGM